jgi:hypothetical protein
MSTPTFPTPLCACCGAPASYAAGGEVLRDDALGPVCADCAHDLSRATVALCGERFFDILRAPKNSKPKTQKK